jgi:hypothetical protein
MSHGFARRRRKAKRLIPLIEECSVVDRGAGFDCTIQITKRDGQQDRVRAAIAPIIQGVVRNVVKRYVQRKREEAQMSSMQEIAKRNQDFAIAEQKHALAMFPESRNVSEALAKWHRTDASKRLTSQYCSDNYRAMQMDGALGNAHNVAKYDGGSADPLVIDWNDPVQASKAVRAEREAKARGEAVSVPSSESLRSNRNDGKGRRMTSANLNRGGQDQP